MIKSFVISVILFLGIIPLAKLRKNVITENELYGIFLGNYIFFMHYVVMILLVLVLVHYLIIPITVKSLAWILPVSLVVIGGIGYYNYRYSDIVYTEITLDKPANVDSIKIAFVADFHLNENSNKNLFVDMVRKINEQKPDIVIIGGDVLQNSHTILREDYSDVFSKLQSKYGTYAILGNHEYYGNDVDENINYLQSLGIKIVRDEVFEIDGIKFVARDDIRRDYMEGVRKTLPELYQEYDVSVTDPIIVIDHNPKNIMESVKNNADVQLSAHTHAGQFFPYNLLLKSRLDNAYGYKKIQNLHAIVTSGVSVGYWKIVGPWQMPYRFGTNSDINIIDIKFK